MNKNLVVTIRGLVQLDIQSDPDHPQTVLDAVHSVINDFNVDITGSPNGIQVINFDNITLADLVWEKGEEPTREQINQWRKDWGQSHDEICSCLEFDPEDDNSTELIMLTGNYFFLIAEKGSDSQWFNKSSCSAMSEEEKEIADWIEENEI